MKRLPARSSAARLRSLFLTIWKPVIVSLFWIISISIAVSLSSEKDAVPIDYTQVCIVNINISRGKTIKKEEISPSKIPLDVAPTNAISDCSQEQLFQIPLLHDVQAGDILQQSSFIDPKSDQGKLRSLLTGNNLKLLYLSPADVHIFPARLEKGQHIAFYAKTKNDSQSFILAPSVEVTDILLSQDEDGKQTITQFGVLITPEQALQLTKVFEQKGVIQIALTTELEATQSASSRIPSPTPKTSR